MFKHFLVFIFFFLHFILFGQTSEVDLKLKAQQEREKLEEESKVKNDSLTDESYKIYYLDGRVQSADTSLSVYKDYKFNFLRYDTFDLISFANSGHTYNKLSYDFSEKNTLQDFGARAKQYNYFEKEDIGYYNVPTPFTEIFAKSTFEQGQILDMLTSINLSPQYNFTLAHKGYKSLGKYVSSRSRGNQFRFSSNYISKNTFTKWRFHFTSQNIFNQETGGLSPEDIYFYEQAPNYFELDNSGNQILNDDGSYKMIYYDGYLDRSRLGAWIFSEGSLYSKRFFSDFRKIVLYNKETKQKVLSVGYQFTHEYKKLEFLDESNGFLFGEFLENNINSEQSRFYKQENKLFLLSDLKKLGELQIGFEIINWKNIFKEYDGLLSQDIPFQIDKKQSKISLDWNKKTEKFQFQIKYKNSLKDEFISNIISAEFKGKPLKNFKFYLKASLSNRSPNFNFHLYRSAYKKYNWNNTNLEDQGISNFFVKISYKDLINISADYNIIDNYTYFKENANQLTEEFQLRRYASPFQTNGQIKYLKLKLSSKINIGKFSLINTAQYQEKDQGELDFNELLTLNVPEWITRSSLMYSANIFNNSLQIQTGFTFNYFTKFYADYYNPLISEFVTQNHTEIGEFPRFDFFFNAKIQQTRVFIKVEHLNSSISGYDFYSDPFNPYRDMSVRLGLVWNFFS